MTIPNNHARTVRIKTKVKAGDGGAVPPATINHNQVRIKTKVKAGDGINGGYNHNQVRIRTKA